MKNYLDTKTGGTTVSRPTQQLPEGEAAKLTKLREAGPNALPKLRARVAALRDAGWSLAAVGAPLNANRSTTRMWQLSAKPEDVTAIVKELGVCTPAPVKRGSVKVVRLFPDVPEDEREELCVLAEQARMVRGHTPENAPARIAARKFEKKLREYKKRGVPVKRMAEIIGITHHAVSARIDRAEARDAARLAS